VSLGRVRAEPGSALHDGAARIRVKVQVGWVIHHSGGTAGAGRVVEVNAKAGERYIAAGTAKRARWWQ
jgi:hypothetical protein